MNRSLKNYRGIGPAKADALALHGIHTAGDLLYYFPRRYVDRSVTSETIITSGQFVTLEVVVKNRFLAHGKKTRLMVNCVTKRGEALTLVFFNSAKYFLSVFEADQTMIVSGKAEYFRGMQMVHPDYEFLDADDESQPLHVGRIVPLYPSTEELKKKNLDSRGLRRLVRAVLDSRDLKVAETLPDEIRAKYNYPLRREALHSIHFPSDNDSLQRARDSLKYEELFLFNVLMKKKREVRSGFPRKLWPVPYSSFSEYAEFLDRLPFQLTGEQVKAIQEINEACQVDHPEAFLLQGDVGSGKTVVALAVALHYAKNRIQTAVMAPTEVLARQHFNTFSDYLGLGNPVRIELITGQDKKKKKEEVLQGLSQGDIDIVVGTHSLIDAAVQFASLGFVVIDEQHRFGVEQREALRKKGENPDILAMTATPIPRSLCLTEFADLRLVVLKEKPAGRKPVKTLMFTDSKRSGVYKSIRKYVSAGKQCFIVFPLVAESEKIDLRAATDAHQELSSVIFPEFRVGLLHGKMKGPERESVMREFREGRIDILVTTTVVEVGVDVPNATIMVIEHAERFGISQLHQLRGRVGRGSEESFCVLMAPEQMGGDAGERLEALLSSDDGFYLSEVDMKIRGPGELLGLKQHGLDNFKLADLVEDRALALQSNEDSNMIESVSEPAVEFIRARFVEGTILFPN